MIPRDYLFTKDVKHVGIRVEPKGVGNCYGLVLDGNQRFILGNFLVVHGCMSS